MVSVSTLPVFLVGAAFFQIGPELAIGPVGLGLLTAIFFLTAASASPRLGRWVQQVGWQRAMRVNVVVSAMVAVSIGVFAHRAWSLGALLMIGALIYASTNPAANLALARHTDPARNGTVFGLKHAGIPTATLMAGLAVPTMVLRFGWRTTFVVAGVLTLLAWLLISHDDSTDARFAGVVARPPLRSGELRRLALVAALGAVAAVALGTYMVSAGVAGGLSEASAGWLQFTGSASSIAARLGAGVAVDRGADPYRGLVVLLGVGAVVFAFLPLAAGVGFVIGVVAAYATGWGWPGLMTASVVASDRSTAASSSAITQAGVFAGAGAGPLVLGIVADGLSYDAMWMVVAGCLAAATAVSWTVVRSARQEPLAPA